MDDLQQWYLGNLPDRIQKLEAFIPTLDNQDPESTEILLRLIHSLRGSGATYGFPVISEKAALVEEAEEEESFRRTLEDFIHTLKQCAGQLQDTRSAVLLILKEKEEASEIENRCKAASRRFLTCHSAAEARTLLGTENVALIIMDLFLPDSDGRALLQEFRSQSRLNACSIFILMDTDSSLIRADCFSKGADEVSKKPLDLYSLSLSVATHLSQSVELKKQAAEDSLTGLLNRASFIEGVQRVQSLAARLSMPLTLATIDLDHMESVNQNFGLDAGDRILARFGKAITQNIRGADIAARWQGDRFMILYSNARVPTAMAALSRLKEVFASCPYCLADKTPVPVTFSCGLTNIERNASIEDVLSQSDDLLYQAKVLGRNRIFHSDSKKTPLRQKVVLLCKQLEEWNPLREVLEGNRFEVHSFTDESSMSESAKEHSYVGLLIQAPFIKNDNFAFLTSLQIQPELSGLPVLLLCQLGQDPLICQGLQKGVTDYVFQSSSPLEIMTRLRRLFKRIV
jgi:diguanylate cyclase (GGDEF)-like protein